MEEDNAYPSQSRFSYLQEPPKQVKAKEQEVAETLEQLPVLRKVLEHLDDRIEATDSVKEAILLAKKYELSRSEALVVLDVVRQQLEVEREYIANRVEKVKR